MKIYEIPKGSVFTLNSDKSKTKYILENTDKMVSTCYRLATFTDMKLEYMGSWEEVEIVN